MADNLLRAKDVVYIPESERNSATPASWIEKTPGVCGDEARIRRMRIPVSGLVAYRQQGVSDSELLRGFPNLTAVDLAAAWEYYEHNRSEIDRDIRRDRLGMHLPIGLSSFDLEQMRLQATTGRQAAPVVVYLPDSERHTATPTTWIQKDPTVAEGVACVRRLKLPVWVVVEWRRVEETDQELYDLVPELTVADVAAAWEYYERNGHEIDEAIHRYVD